jgi:hypothetical protein
MKITIFFHLERWEITPGWGGTGARITDPWVTREYTWLFVTVRIIRRAQVVQPARAAA